MKNKSELASCAKDGFSIRRRLLWPDMLLIDSSSTCTFMCQKKA